MGRCNRNHCRTCFYLLHNSELGWVCNYGGILRIIDTNDPACKYYHQWNEPMKGKRVEGEILCPSTG